MNRKDAKAQRFKIVFDDSLRLCAFAPLRFNIFPALVVKNAATPALSGFFSSQIPQRSLRSNFFNQH